MNKNKLTTGREYVFSIKHDKGVATIRTMASSLSAAKRKVAEAEGCPISAIKLKYGARKL